MGSRITSSYSEGRRAAHVGQAVTGGRRLHRQLGPDMPGRSTPAHRPEGYKRLPESWECGRASHRGARCGTTACRDLCGGRRVTGVPTVTTSHDKKINQTNLLWYDQ